MKQLLTPNADKITAWFPKLDVYFIEGFDGAILGIDIETSRIIYSVDRCINIIISNTPYDIDEDEASDIFDNEIATIHVGDKSPIFCYDTL